MTEKNENKVKLEIGKMITDFGADFAQAALNRNFKPPDILALVESIYAKTARLVAEEIFKELDDNFQLYIESTNDGFIYHDKKWQALKSRFF